MPVFKVVLKRAEIATQTAVVLIQSDTSVNAVAQALATDWDEEDKWHTDIDYPDYGEPRVSSVTEEVDE